MRTGSLSLLLMFAGAFLPASGGTAPATPAPLPSAVRQALDEAASGRKCSAEHRIDAWLQKHPGSVGGHVIRGDLRFDCLRVAGAIEDYRFVLKHQPGDPYVEDRLIEALLLSLDYRGAARLLEQRLARRPGDSAATSALRQARKRTAEIQYLAARGRLFRWLAAGAALLWALLLLGLLRRAFRP